MHSALLVWTNSPLGSEKDVEDYLFCFVCFFLLAVVLVLAHSPNNPLETSDDAIPGGRGANDDWAPPE